MSFLSKVYTKIEYSLYLMSEIKKFFRKLRVSNSMSKSNVDSLRTYQLYDDREQRNYENDSRIMSFNGIYKRISFKKAKEYYNRALFDYIDALIEENKGSPISILEVGCGNCINLLLLSEKYGSKITLTGIDISSERINVAKNYFGKKLNNVQFNVSSITTVTEFNDGEFDLVFSMHCIEQITYETKLAVKEMYRLSSKMVVFIEPVFENANMVQKLYLINIDHCRILLKSITELGYKILENRVLDIQSNPRNQSSVIVVGKE